MLKVLLLDIETAPKVTYSWGVWKQNHYSEQLISDTFMLTWAAKWLDEDEVHGRRVSKEEALDGYDSNLVKDLWFMLDEADIVIGHNSDRFDLPHINKAFILNGYLPPSPYRKIDTLKIARRHFNFTYNKLDYLGEILGVGRKIDTGGFELWKRCMGGEVAALEDMLAYNKQDVILLEKVYKRLLPYTGTIPSHSVENDGEDPKCPKCASTSMQRRGYQYSNLSRFQRYRCNDCGSWSRGRTDTRTTDEVKNTLSPIA